MFFKNGTTPKQDAQLKQLINSTFLSYGNIYLYLSIVFFAMLMIVWFIRLGWFTICVALAGVFSGMILCFVRGIANPFGEYWFLATGKVPQITIEQRKVWTFLKKTKEVKLIIVVVSLIYGSTIIIKIISIMLGVNTFPFSGVVNHLVVFLAYFFIAPAVVTTQVFRFIIKHWSKIQSMDIEPWPLDKPYMTRLFSNKPIQPQPRTVFAPLVENQDKELTSVQTIAIFLGFLGTGFIFLGWTKDILPAFQITQKGRLIILMIGLVIVFISSALWKQNKKR